jgi:HEAT repeat protein
MSGATFGERIGAVQALGKPGNNAAVTTLAHTLATDPNPHVRGYAVLALSAIGTPEALAVILDAVGDESTEVRLRVAPALGRFNDESAWEALEWLSLEDVEPRVRARASLILGFLKETRGQQQNAIRQ